MAFSPRQMQALMMLFKMNGNQREQLFSSPRSDSSRTPTDCSSSTSGSLSCWFSCFVNYWITLTGTF